MNILPFQANIAARMLVNTENEQIHPEAQFVHTHNGYWLAWHDGIAALLAPDHYRHQVFRRDVPGEGRADVGRRHFLDIVDIASEPSPAGGVPVGLAVDRP